MKLVIGTVATVSGVLFALSMASANPSLLPKHEGYPMKNSGSPVTGQPTANDPGQSDARGESTLMKSADSIKNAQQNLMKTDNARITTGQGANQLPIGAGATDHDRPSGDLRHEDHRRSEDRVVRKSPFSGVI